MRFTRFGLVVTLLALAMVVVMPAAAQDGTPSVTVSDQFVTDSVFIDNVVSPGQGFVVIHIDANGAPGPVAGFAPVAAGTTTGLWIELDPTMAAPTPVLYAMLHEDTGAVGTYEFGTVDGVDLPVSVNGQIVTPAFNAAIIHAHSQFVANNTFVADSVTIPVNGWLVIHSEANGGPGPVLGQTQIAAGTSANVNVTLSGITNTVWPMLHVDDGTTGTYEFDGSSGLDNPIVVGGRVATTPVSTVATISADPQPLIKGDGQPTSTGAFTFHAHEALIQGPGWLVIHADNNGQPGPVVGQAPLTDGLNEEIDVSINSDGLTLVVWPMLHVDDGTIGTYEFDGSSGFDNPVSVDGQVVTFPVNIAPSLTLSDQAGTVANGQVTFTIDEAVIDQPGWIAIHTSANGAPGPVIGSPAIVPNFVRGMSVTVDAAGAGSQVFPMLHYDTNTIGVYEFGTVEGADPPVAVRGNIVVAPLNLTGGGATGADTTGADTTAPPATTPCTVTPAGGSNVNIRSEATTDSAPIGTLASGSSAEVNGQAPLGNNIWFRLTQGGWVRGDVVVASGDCANLPIVELSQAQPPAADPTAAPPPVATQEVQAPAATPETSG